MAVSPGVEWWVKSSRAMQEKDMNTARGVYSQDGGRVEHERFS